MRTFTTWFVLSLFALTLSADNVLITLVRDGDTVVVENEDGKDESVRLVGIDSPEWVTRQGGRWVVVAQCWAAEASQTLRSVAKGRSARLVRTGKDSYGRTLGYLYLAPEGTLRGLDPMSVAQIPSALKDLERQSLNRWMVKYGHARAYLRFPHSYTRSYLAAESEAKANKRGMWGACQ